ncbi:MULTISPECIES: MgtC/SapB family protein [Clostridium]|uniref:MgtC/SapB family protein n=1 Tax=Clostridium TaxID=1485 RepID=UPI0005C2166C|nr:MULTISPECIES: MgtC/SapB family protein [Clostridium]AXB84992.1 MgtC/SapB family protein [Clostridium butyricum]KIU08026.1 cation-transporting ATPase [Clostridium butyricum]MBA8967865.1 putative Mg2+ transporter-C (MgtC) family protein [Clostridium butyricum]MBA8971081.1 putative Mg2+ transporter-C (MgtC) family protein [Clostridium butyricum]MBC2427143.1 MgtC/SapB family protein [Clostridium butyricum]
MKQLYLIQLDYLLRLFIAAVCGMAIGYERKNRMKEAGIRTHFIVAIGAALIMIISKYGFQDQIGWPNMSLDPSRIAAQVVTGVGFLGAGVIFMQKQTIVGLTTAAGVWVTAAIGLSIGSGLYFVGIAATVITILGQILLHGKIRFLSSPRTETLMLQIVDNADAIKLLQGIFEDNEIIILNLKSKRDEKSSLINVEVIIRVYESFNMTKFLNILQSKDFIKSLEF